MILHEKKILPGSYKVEIAQVGYSSKSILIDILPSEEPFIISGNLFANTRKIVFEMIDPNTGVLVEPLEIINLKLGKSIELKDVYQPGQSYTFKIKFAQHQTQKISGIITPGEEPFIIAVPMVKLKSLECAIRKQMVVQDGIDYPLSFNIDNKEIEEHLIKIEKGIGRFYYTFMIPHEAKNFEIYGGYTFLLIPLDTFRPNMSIGRLGNISIPKLIAHLNRVAEKDAQGLTACLDAMESKLKNFRYRKMLKLCSSAEKIAFINFLKSWGNVERIVINYKDRLMRFGNEIIEEICRIKNVSLIVLNKIEEENFETKLAQDIISILTVFCAKVYGKRSHAKKLKTS